MLSKAQQNETEHLPVEPWTIEKIFGVRENVTENGMLPTPDNLKGCTDKPLFNAVPICNFVIPVLHIIIGIENIFVDCIFEWIEEHIEKLTPAETEARNSYLFAKVQYDRVKEHYDEWLQNDGILLVDKQFQKSFLSLTFHEKVSLTWLHLCRNHIIIYKTRELL